MQIRVSLTVKEKTRVEDTIELDDRKLEGLTEEEIEGAIEVLVRQWANDAIRIEWESDDPGDEAETERS